MNRSVVMNRYEQIQYYVLLGGDILVMEIERKIITYIEKNHISKQVMAEVLAMNIEKFNIEQELNWTSQEMLQICAYLGISPDRI